MFSGSAKVINIRKHESILFHNRMKQIEYLICIIFNGTKTKNGFTKICISPSALRAHIGFETDSTQKRETG